MWRLSKGLSSTTLVDSERDAQEYSSAAASQLGCPIPLLLW